MRGAEYGDADTYAPIRPFGAPSPACGRRKESPPLAGEGKAALPPAGEGKDRLIPRIPQLFNLYPVRKIHHTATRHSSMKPVVMPTLRTMSTSDLP